MNISTGCASGVDAIGHAFELIRDGKFDIAIAGGAEAPLTPLTFGSFYLIGVMSKGNNGAVPRPFDKQRDGIVLSEGAAVLVLEEFGHAQNRGAPIYAELVGYGTTHDAYHLTQPAPDGRQIARAMAMALDSADMEPDEVEFIAAHAPGTVLNDKVETAAIKAVFGSHAHTLSLTGLESMFGHPLGASGSLKAAAAALTIRYGVIPPTINYKEPDPECDLDCTPLKARRRNVRAALVNAFSFGGKNSILALRQMRG